MMRIVVIGDCMLDENREGLVKRLSPDAPVPVLSDVSETYLLGGAANVMAKLRELDIDTQLVSVIGKDSAGQNLLKLCAGCGCDTDFILQVTDRPTIVKTRFVGNGQHLLRVDTEKVQDLTEADEKNLVEKTSAALTGAQLLILSDYAKGCLTHKVIAEAMARANDLKIPIVVDPKGRDFSKYKGADFITPNRKELGEAVGYAVKSDEEIVKAAREIISRCGIGAVIATRSEDGLSVVTRDDVLHLQAEAKTVRSVSGAGDTLIANLARALAQGASITDAAKTANTAAAKMVETGATPTDDFTKMNGGIWTDVALVRHWQKLGLKVGFTNGCFDILHAGHVNYLNETRLHCDRLVLGLNHDKSVRILKGPTRPVNMEADRKTVMENLKPVDLVVLFGAEQAGQDNTPCHLIEALKPDVFFKGGDYTIEQLPEAKVVQSYGGDVKLMGLTDGKSTTGIINKINAS